MTLDPARSKDDGGRIQISVPKIYLPTDDSVWEDIEKYLFQGFLTSHAAIHNQNFVFKTINYHELKMIEFLRPFSQSTEEKKNHYRSAFIAHSIFLANGNNVLVDREKNIGKLIKIVSRLSSVHQEKIFENLSALNERASRAFPLTEVYSFENRARFRWLQLSSAQINVTSNTGISGTESLGMNHCQAMFTALNKIYDRRDILEREWQHAKFVGSCMAGKGMRSVEEQDRNRHERERIEREEEKIRVLRSYLNRTTAKDKIPVDTVRLPDGRTAEVVSRHRADSADELAEQLTNALNGEKDTHDLAIESHFKRMADRQKEIEQERKQLMARSLSRPLPDSASYEVISREEAELRIRRLREAMLSGDHQIVPDLMNSNSDSE